MSNPSRPAPRRKGLVALVIAAVGAVVAWTWWGAPLTAAGGATRATAPEPAAAPAVVATRTADVASAPSAWPGGLSAGQWARVESSVDPGPDHDRELARIADLLEFRRDVARLRELRGDSSAAGERLALARAIDAGIGTHLALREVTGGEAALLKTAPLAELEPDPTRHASDLEAWRRDWMDAHPPESDPRVAEYQRREAAVVAAWQSGPPSQRDPVQLARRLQQLQVAVFDAASEGGR
jgi:hypothetical protein